MPCYEADDPDVCIPDWRERGIKPARTAAGAGTPQALKPPGDEPKDEYGE